MYATYDVEEKLSDKKVHNLIDQLNPNLRAVEEFDGKPRIREFYEMSAEEAYALLENIAAISGTSSKLHKCDPTGHEITDEELAEEIRTERKERKSPFSFEKCHLKPGTQLDYYHRDDIKAEVYDDRFIKFNGTVTGTDIDKIMPPVSRFGGGRDKKKENVIGKLKGFFEKFFGVGGVEFKADKVVDYPLPEEGETLMMVAEKSEI